MSAIISPSRTLWTPGTERVARRVRKFLQEIARPFWLNEDGKWLINDDGKFYVCDDCPCERCPSFASPPSSLTLTLTGVDAGLCTVCQSGYGISSQSVRFTSINVDGSYSLSFALKISNQLIYRLQNYNPGIGAMVEADKYTDNSCGSFDSVVTWSTLSNFEVRITYSASLCISTTIITDFGINDQDTTPTGGLRAFQYVGAFNGGVGLPNQLVCNGTGSTLEVSTTGTASVS